MTRRPPPNRNANRMRGSAAVEFLLSVPFLVLFCLGMMDFARGFISAQRGQRAARPVAWAEGRSPGGTVTREVATQEEAALGIISSITDAVASVLEWFNEESRLASMISFMGGNVEMTQGMATQEVIALTATTSGQTSNPLPEEEHGLFTYYLLNALSGKADENEDRFVTIKEIYTYVTRHVTRAARRMGKEQTPFISPSMGVLKDVSVSRVIE